MARKTKWSSEALLDWVRRRSDGQTCGQIARAYPGVHRQYVSTATNRVKRADEAVEGRSLREEYW